MAKASNLLRLVECIRGVFQTTNHDHLTIEVQGVVLAQGHLGAGTFGELVQLEVLRLKKLISDSLRWINSISYLDVKLNFRRERSLAEL